MEIISLLIGFILTVGMGWFAYMSSVLVAEKKARFHAGTHDYYDNPIEKRCLGGEDDDSLMNIVYSNKDGDEND